MKSLIPFFCNSFYGSPKTKMIKSLPYLPRELWGLVFKKLDNPLDQIQFGGVSLFFLSVAKENNQCRLSRALLMQPPSKDSDTREFFSLVNNNIYQIELPDLKNKWCCGSSFGWLFIVDFQTGEINLLNPFTKETILLPHISKFADPMKPGFDQDRDEIWYVKKAILSAPPCKTEDFVVMVVFTNSWALAFCKPGDKKWITLTEDRGPCEDVAYYKEKFYVITNWGALVTWDLCDSKAPEMTVLIDPTHEVPYYRYLVELPDGSGLLKISKLDDENTLTTTGFKVFKLDDRGEGMKSWIEVTSLGDHAVFLGYNRVVCLSVNENPEFLGNSVYFTEDNAEKYYNDEKDGCNDVGVYRLEDGSIREFYKDHPFWKCHCIWVVPSFRRSLKIRGNVCSRCCKNLEVLGLM